MLFAYFLNYISDHLCLKLHLQVKVIDQMPCYIQHLHTFQDASLVDQVADEIQNQFIKMRFPTPTMTKIRLVMPAITIRIPPNLVNDVSDLRLFYK